MICYDIRIPFIVIYVTEKIKKSRRELEESALWQFNAAGNGKTHLSIHSNCSIFNQIWTLWTYFCISPIYQISHKLNQ